MKQFGMSIASAVGIVVAAFFNLTQAAEASSLFVINKWVSQVSMLAGIGNVPLYIVILILSLIGAFAIFFFQPVTMRGAFVQGFGLLAALTTIAPSELGRSLPGMVLETLAEAPAGRGGDDLRVPVAYASTASSQTVADEEGFSLRMRIVFPKGLPAGKTPSDMIAAGTLRGKLYNEASGETYNLFRNSGADVTFSDNVMAISSRIPGDSVSASFVARIEADGYRIIESRFDANVGQNALWTITLAPSATPLFLQRLTRPYWF